MYWSKCIYPLCEYIVYALFTQQKLIFSIVAHYKSLLTHVLKNYLYRFHNGVHLSSTTKYMYVCFLFVRACVCVFFFHLLVHIMRQAAIRWLPQYNLPSRSKCIMPLKVAYILFSISHLFGFFQHNAMPPTLIRTHTLSIFIVAAYANVCVCKCVGFFRFNFSHEFTCTWNI